MLVTGACLLIVAQWFSMSDLNYHRGTTVFPFRTSGWFVLGFPFIVAISLAYSALFWVASRWTGRKAAWLAMLALSCALIAASVYSALPSTRIKSILGEEAAAETTLEVLRVSDSFNDGLTYVGKLTGSEQTLERISLRRPLVVRPSERLSDLACRFKDDSLPEFGTVYADDHGSFYLNPQSGRIYFLHYSRK